MNEWSEWMADWPWCLKMFEVFKIRKLLKRYMKITKKFVSIVRYHTLIYYQKLLWHDKLKEWYLVLMIVIKLTVLSRLYNLLQNLCYKSVDRFEYISMTCFLWAHPVQRHLRLKVLTL
jgi:hypothetical protein